MNLNEKKLLFARIALRAGAGHLRDLGLLPLAKQVEEVIEQVNQELREGLPDPEPGVLEVGD
jgi:hypothetical protein